MTGADELVIKVRIDASQAKTEIEKQDKAARALGGALSSSMGMLAGVPNMLLNAGAAGLSLIFGPSASQSWSNIHNVAGTVGRATGLGQQIERDSARLNAVQSARAQTAELFGMAGATARKEDILAVYNAILGPEMRERKGMQRVEGIIDEKNATETLKAVEFLIHNLGAVLQELTASLKNALRMELR